MPRAHVGQFGVTEYTIASPLHTKFPLICEEVGVMGSLYMSELICFVVL